MTGTLRADLHGELVILVPGFQVVVAIDKGVFAAIPRAALPAVFVPAHAVASARLTTWSLEERTISDCAAAYDAECHLESRPQSHLDLVVDVDGKGEADLDEANDAGKATDCEETGQLPFRRRACLQFTEHHDRKQCQHEIRQRVERLVCRQIWSNINTGASDIGKVPVLVDGCALERLNEWRLDRPQNLKNPETKYPGSVASVDAENSMV